MNSMETVLADIAEWKAQGIGKAELMARMGVPVPKILLQALEIMKAKGNGYDKDKKEETLESIDGKKYRLVEDQDGSRRWEIAEGEQEGSEKEPEEVKPEIELDD